jgi:hypothetical protein
MAREDQLNYRQSLVFLLHIANNSLNVVLWLSVSYDALCYQHNYLILPELPELPNATRSITLLCGYIFQVRLVQEMLVNKPGVLLMMI